MPGRTDIVDVTTTWVALAIGLAMLVGAFGLVAQVEDAAFSWQIVVVLALSVALFLGCALLSIRLAWSALRALRRADDPSRAAAGIAPGREAPRTRDRHGG